MRDDQDPFVARLFAEQDQHLPIDDFIAQVVKRLEREQRKRRIYQTTGVAAIIFCVSLAAPWIVQSTAAVFAAMSLSASALSSVIPISLAGLVAAAFVVALLPVLYLWRTSRW